MTTYRKTWDKDVFEARALERLRKEEGNIVSGKKRMFFVYAKHIPLYFQLFRIRDFSHIWWESDPFSIADQRNLGMKVERSTLSQVQARFQYNRRKKEEALRNEVGKQHAQYIQ